MVVDRRTVITSMILIIAAFAGYLFNSTVSCRICVMIILIICIYKGSKEKKFVNPYFLFAFVPFSLLIYANISDYTMDLSVNTWILAIINMVAFIVAFDLTPSYQKEYKCVGVGEDGSLIMHTYILLAMGMLPSIYTLVLGGSMPLASIFTLFSTPAIVCAMKTKNWKVILSVAIVFVLSSLTYVTKSSMLTFVIALLISFEKYYVKSRRGKRYLIALSVVAVLVMIASFGFANQGRGSLYGLDAVSYYSKYGNLSWNLNDNLLMPYLYLTTPWTNLQYVLTTQTDKTYGLWLLKPLISYFQMDSYFENFYTMTAYSSFNTFTYIACCYKDFGFWGSIFSSAFLAYFSKKVYSRYLISKSPLDVGCYVLLAQAVLEMFFSNEFYTQSFPFTIVIICGVYKMIFCRGYDAELEEDIDEFRVGSVDSDFVCMKHSEVGENQYE